MRLSAKNKICLIIGDPIDHSLSPAMHNAAYESLGIDDQFVYLGSNVKVEHLKEVIKAMRVMRFRGLTCTMPHKIEVLKYLDEIDDVAQKIGAVNTVVNEKGILKGYNTDWLGAVMPLEKIMELKNKKTAILGAGGAARSIVYGMILKGAQVRILNRTKEKAIKLADEFDCEGSGLDNLEDLEQYDIIINATPVGMNSFSDESLIPSDFISENHIIFDIVYKPFETKLLKDAKKKGATIVYGLEMLLYQGVGQFELYTNHAAPVEIMRQELYKQLKIK